MYRKRARERETESCILWVHYTGRAQHLNRSRDIAICLFFRFACCGFASLRF